MKNIWSKVLKTKLFKIQFFYAGQVDLVALLLSRGANINSRNIYGKSALYIAATDARKGVGKVFLDQIHLKRKNYH